MENCRQENRTTKLPAKLKTLQLAQNNFATIGIIPNLTLQPYPINGKIVFGFLTLSSYLICNLMFAFFEAKTFTEYTQSIYMGSLATLIISCLAVIVFNVEKLFQIINDCENIVNATLKYSASRSIFNETVQFERKLSGIIFFVMLKMTPNGTFLSWMIYMFFNYFVIDSGNAAFELPFPIWFPFGWKNPIGFLIALAILYVMLTYALKIGACVIDLGIGVFLYFIAMSKCIKQNLFEIAQSTRSKSERKLIREQIIEYIEFDSNAKRLVHKASDLFQQFIAILFLWSLVTMCGALLMIQMQIVQHSDNLAELLITAFQIFYAFSTLLIACELCQRINLAFDECIKMIYQFDWYLLPAKIQRMLPFVIHCSQQPVEVKCFGNIACNGKTFGYVIRTAFSFFMFIRKFYD